MDLIDGIKKYIKGKLPLKDFGDILVHSAIGYISQKQSNEAKTQLFTQLIQLVPQLTAEVYDNYPRPFMEFAINISDRLIYAELKLLNIKFEDVQKDLKPQGNTLALYLLYKVLNCQNKMLLTHYIDEQMNKCKQIEAKFVLLEMYRITFKQIESSVELFKNILPNIKRPLKDGLNNIVQFYLENRLKDKKVNDPDGYFATFSQWMLDYMKRVLLEIKGLKELKKVKELTGINDLFEQGDNGRLFQKFDNQAHILKHYCVLFYLDIFDNIYNLYKLSDGQVDYITKSYEQTKKQVLEFVGNNTLQVLQYGLYQFKFLAQHPEPEQEDWQKNSAYTEYSLYSTYNIQTMAVFLLELAKKPDFKFIFSGLHQMQMVLPVFVSFYRQRTQQVGTKLELLDLAVEVFERLPKNYQIQNGVAFEVEIQEFVDHALVNFGNKSKTEKFISDLILRHDKTTQAMIIEHCMKFNAGIKFLNEYFIKEQINNKDFVLMDQNVLNNQFLDKFILKMDQEFVINNTKVIIGFLEWVQKLNKENFSGFQQIQEKLEILSKDLNKFGGLASKEVVETQKEIRRDPEQQEKDSSQELQFYEVKEREIAQITKLFQEVQQHVAQNI